MMEEYGTATEPSVHLNVKALEPTSTKPLQDLGIFSVPPSYLNGAAPCFFLAWAQIPPPSKSSKSPRDFHAWLVPVKLIPFPPISNGNAAFIPGFTEPVIQSTLHAERFRNASRF